MSFAWEGMGIFAALHGVKWAEECVVFVHAAMDERCFGFGPKVVQTGHRSGTEPKDFENDTDIF